MKYLDTHTQAQFSLVDRTLTLGKIRWAQGNPNQLSKDVF